jgi:hypothetical protein
MVKRFLVTLLFATIAVAGISVIQAHEMVVINGGVEQFPGGTVFFDITLLDNVKIILGTGGDSEVYYDGSDLQIDPDVVGTGKVVLDGINFTNDGTTSDIIGPSGDYTRIGDAAGTNRGLASEDDLMVTGQLEVDGVVNLDGNTVLTDGAFFAVGNSGDLEFIYNSGFNELLAAMGAGSHMVNFTSLANIAKDHDVAAQTNPTILVFSATDPDSANDEWISITHNVTNGVITSGSGGVTVDGVNIGTAATVVTLLAEAGKYLRVGDAATTGHSLDSEDDLMITGELEVDGEVWIDNSASFTLGASDKVLVDAATTDNTGTAGVLDIDLDTATASGAGIIVSSTLTGDVDQVAGITSQVTGLAAGGATGNLTDAFNATLNGDADDTNHDYVAYQANGTKNGGTSTFTGLSVATGFDECLLANSGDMSFEDYAPTIATINSEDTDQNGYDLTIQAADGYDSGAVARDGGDVIVSGGAAVNGGADGVVTVEGLSIMNNGTITTLLGTAGDYLRVGDAGTTGHSLNSEDDCMITGELEVDGAAWYDAGVTVASVFISTPPADRILSTAGGWPGTISANARYVRVGGTAALTLTSDPTITAGSSDGQEIIVQGVDDVNTITIQDESNNPGSTLELVGDVNFLIGKGDIWHGIWDSGDSKWYEIGRSDN